MERRDNCTESSRAILSLDGHAHDRLGRSRDYAHAVQLFVGTRTALTNVLNPSLPPPTSRTTTKEFLTLAELCTIQRLISDLQVSLDVLEESPGGFTDWRPFVAHQAMVLWIQISWKGKMTMERIIWCVDHPIELFGRNSN